MTADSPRPTDCLLPAADLAELDAENQREMLAYLGTAACARREGGASYTAVLTGVHSNDYNGVVWSRMDADEAHEQVPALVERFRASGVPALWHLDPASRPADLAARLEQEGCRRLDAGVCMVVLLADLRVERPSLHGLTVERVRTRDDLAAWIDVWIAEDDERREPRERLYHDLGLDGDQPLRHYLARIEGEPVGVSQLFLGGRAAGLYGVAVLPAFRRRGIGSALASVPLLDARDLGYRYGVLGPTPDGAPMYRKMGFEMFPSACDDYVLWIDP